MLTDLINSECLGIIECQCETTIDNGRVINCRNKQLSSVPKFVDSRDHFKELTLEGNKIQDLQSSAFGNLIVNTINLKGNPINYIDSNAFLGIESDLKTLILGLNQGVPFPSASLSGLINLESLQIYNFSQPKLPTDAFHGIQQLQELALVDGKLSDLYTPSLNGLTRLSSLKLDSNQFTVIPVLSQMHALKKFSIVGNLINNLDVNSFKNSSSTLEEIDLSGNKLAGNIALDTFTTLSNSLKYLTFTSCELIGNSFPAFNAIKSLTTLNLQGNNIAGIPDNFLQNLTNLLQLNLVQNKITTLSENVFKNSLSSLMTLNLADNPLSVTTSNTFSSLTSIETLIFKNLKSVHLGPQALQPMQKTLKLLDLSNTPTDGTIFAALSPLTLLQELNLSSCGLTSMLDLGFKNNYNLRILDVGQNKITNLPILAFGGLEKSLTQLNLGNNKLTTLDRCSFGNLQYLDPLKLHVQGNPLKCDCSLKWLYDKIKTQSESYLSTLTWTCDSGEMFSSMGNTFAKCPTEEIPCTNLNKNDSEFRALTLEIRKLTENSALLYWSVVGAKVIYGFTVSCETLESTPHYSKTSELPNSFQEFLLSDLSPSTKYKFCITMLASSDWTHETKSCSSGETLPSSSINLLGPILGGVLGGIAFITILCIVIYCVLMRKNLLPRKTKRAAKSQTIAADDSFSKQSVKSTSHLTLPYTLREIPPSPQSPIVNNLTSQEQDNILSFMLASTVQARGNLQASEKWSQNSFTDLNNSATVTENNQNVKRKKHLKKNGLNTPVNGSYENVFERSDKPSETTV